MNYNYHFHFHAPVHFPKWDTLIPFLQQWKDQLMDTVQQVTDKLNDLITITQTGFQNQQNSFVELGNTLDAETQQVLDAINQAGQDHGVDLTPVSERVEALRMALQSGFDGVAQQAQQMSQRVSNIIP